jgi:NADPH:quinone reductase-like Zn-dependent oxidoreductase
VELAGTQKGKPMRAIEQHGYGDPREVLHLVEVAVPEPKVDEVLVRVCASSANP